jgi:proline iminopeptidase
MNTAGKLASVVGLIAAYGAGVRPRMLRWGATDDEVRRPYPGADLIPGGKRGATMATTIDAPRAEVWSWLVQMGCDRAGWYSWDLLDNGGVSSADRIHPQWQEIAVGQHMSSSPSGKTWFQVAAVQPDRFLALRASYDLRGRPFDPAGRRPRGYSDSVWCFLLEEAPHDRTRLIVSGYADARPQLLQAVQNVLFWEPSHWIMQTRQFTNLKRRAERLRASGAPVPETLAQTVTH